MNRIVSKKLLKGYLNLESGQMNEINIKRSGGQVSTESLWAFPLDNWNQRTEIFTKGIMLSTKEEKIMPLVEGKMKLVEKNIRRLERDGEEVKIVR